MNTRTFLIRWGFFPPATFQAALPQAQGCRLWKLRWCLLFWAGTLGPLSWPSHLPDPCVPRYLPRRPPQPIYPWSISRQKAVQPLIGGCQLPLDPPSRSTALTEAASSTGTVGATHKKPGQLDSATPNWLPFFFPLPTFLPFYTINYRLCLHIREDTAHLPSRSPRAPSTSRTSSSGKQHIVFFFCSASTSQCFSHTRPRRH